MDLDHMNALTLVFASILIFALAYRFYGIFMAQKVLRLNDAVATPAVEFADGHDYVKTDRKVLFGHHFAAIAAAGPLVGPVLAAQFGYLPGALWILIGCVLAVVFMIWLSCLLPYGTKGKVSLPLRPRRSAALSVG